MQSLPVFECDGCGACCRAIPVFAAQSDVLREPRLAAEAQRLPDHLSTSEWTYRLVPLPFLQQCPFLSEQNRCGIYETRPQVCRDFPAGGWHCQLARQRKNLPPLTPVSS